jgi:hypothetical protein
MLCPGVTSPLPTSKQPRTRLRLPVPDSGGQPERNPLFTDRKILPVSDVRFMPEIAEIVHHILVVRKVLFSAYVMALDKQDCRKNTLGEGKNRENNAKI